MRFVPILVTTLLIGSALSSPPATRGQDDLQPQFNQKWETARIASWHIDWENDAFVALGGSDEFYTNGVRVSWLRNTNNTAVKPEPRQVGSLVDWWCDHLRALCPDTAPDIGFGGAIGQNFYTPTDISIRQLQSDDRPYAAWLYYSLLAVARQDTSDDPRRTRPVQHLFEVQLGVTGPPALGEFVQDSVHRLIDDERPLGWDNEIAFEPGVNLIYQWRKRLGGRGRHFDLTPHAGFSLGTVMTYANVGATARLGFNLSGLPTMTITPTAAGIGRERPSHGELYLFASVDGRAVLHNVFLDGNLFRDSHSVNKEDFVTDFKYGFSLRCSSWRFTYTIVRRSAEFVPAPPGADADHEFGNINLTYQIWPPPPD